MCVFNRLPRLPYVFISWIWMSLHFYPDLISLNNTFIIYARDTPPFVQSIQWCASMAFWIHRIPIFNFAKSGILYFRLNWNRTEVFDITMSSLQDCEVNQSDTVVSKAIQKEICLQSFSVNTKFLCRYQFEQTTFKIYNFAFWPRNFVYFNGHQNAFWSCLILNVKDCRQHLIYLCT